MTELTLESLAERVASLERQVAELKQTNISLHDELLLHGVEEIPESEAGRNPTNIDPLGTTGDEQSDNPEAVARWVAAFKAIPPLQMTPEEEADWHAARAEQKRLNVARMDQIIAGLPGTAE